MDRNEVWRDVCGFEGFYQISNLGNIKSLDRYVSHGVNGKKFIKGRMMKPHKIQKGYLQVTLRNGKKRRLVVVHRLVAEAFLPEPPFDNMCIDHINMDKTDNRVCNLEWVTFKENTRRAWDKGACKKPLQRRSCRVVRLSDMKIFPSIKQASRDLGIPYSTLRYKCDTDNGFKYLREVAL